MDCSYCGTSNRDEDKFCRKCKRALRAKGEVPQFSKVKIGWMVWWRALLPIEIVSGLITRIQQFDFIIIQLALLPFLLLLLNWAGRTVARKMYTFDPSLFTREYIPIGFTVIPVPTIGWRIFWRTILVSIPLRIAWLIFSSFGLASEDIFLLFAALLLLPIYIFLTIIILGWAAKRTIEPMKASMQ